MIKSIKKLFRLLDRKYKKKLLLSQIILILAAIFEMLGLLGIAPLMQLISNVDILDDKSQLITKVYIFFDVSSYAVFLRTISIGILFIFLINFLLSVYSLFLITKFSQDVGNFLKLKLFKVYSLQPWIFHSQREMPTYINKIIYETNRISQAVILPLLQTNAKLMIGLAIIIFIFLYNPVISTVCFLVFFTFYFVIFKVIKKKMDSYGVIISKASESIYKKLSETFGGMKETILHKKQKKFHNEFSLKTKEYSKTTVSIQFLQSAPKIVLEFIAFSIIVFSIIYTSSLSVEENFQKTLPILAVYIFAGYKLLPIFQQMYFGLMSLKANKSAVDSVYDELEGKDNNEFMNEEILPKKILDLKNKIEFKNVSFSYQDNDNLVVKNISLDIPANSFTSIVGPSGAGKSTILDILLGLLIPKQGEVTIDESPLSSILEHYQQNISYVGQNIFLKNETIKENICFGLNKSEIDEKKFLSSIGAANLKELIDELPNGVDTMVGERGIKISGGQQQRVAIARALYLDRKIIVLDEATSSLDGISENNILKRLSLFAGSYKKTIIMVTHNINLTRSSDVIHLIDKGSLVESGNFNSLLTNDIFKKLLNEQ